MSGRREVAGGTGSRVKEQGPVHKRVLPLPPGPTARRWKNSRPLWRKPCLPEAPYPCLGGRKGGLDQI